MNLKNYEHINIFFSIKMTEENLKVSVRIVNIVFSSPENVLYYNVSFYCENTEKEYERGYIYFLSDDGEKWECTFRHVNLRKLKLDHIFTDSMITKHLTEIISKLVSEK